jgi:predicted metal-dependent peptidase
MTNTKIDFNTPERKLNKAKLTLMQAPMFQFMVGVMLMGKISVDNTHGTAVTNGRDKLFPTKMLEALNVKEISFVLAHETFHCAFKHLYIYAPLAKDNPELANMAMDFWINEQLEKIDTEGTYMKMPSGDWKGLRDTRFDGMTIIQIYRLLKQDQQQNGGKGGKGSIGVGFDSHDFDGAEELTEEEQKELKQEIETALRQGRIAQDIADKKAGKGSISDALGLDELYAPQIDWKEMLREFITQTCAGRDDSSWRRFNRRLIGQDLYLPSLISECAERVCIAIDTSGSIDRKTLTEFLSEVAAIFSTIPANKVDLLYWDTSIASHEEYDKANYAEIINSTKPKGGGGTDASCVPEYLIKNNITPQCTILFTDGYVSSWGQDKYNHAVLTVILDNKGTYAPMGKTLHMSSHT